MPALAQTQQQSGAGGTVGYLLSIGKGEGSLPPPFVVNSGCWYFHQAADPDPSISPTKSFGFSVAYRWGGANGPQRVPLQAGGSLNYDLNHNGYDWGFDLAGDALRGFGANSTVLISERDGSYTDTKVAAPYVYGVSVIQVNGPDGKGIAGATVYLGRSGDYGRMSDPVNGTTNASGRLVMGQGLYAAADVPYSPGLASDTYLLRVVAPGYADANAGAGVGSTMPGQTFTVAMASSGSTVGAPTATAPASNPDTPPTAGGSGGSSIIDLSKLNDFVTSFFDKFKAAMVDLFTPSPSDVDALKAAANQFFTWGPFGLASAIKSAWEASGNNLAVSNSDPTYWYFPLTMGALTGLTVVTVPSGYSSAIEAHYQTVNNRLASRVLVGGERPRYAVPRTDASGHSLRPSAVTTASTAMDINTWTALIPDHWDCRPYAYPILIMRGLAWGASWVSFGFFLRNKFTPDIRI